MFKPNKNANGEVQRYKARLVAKGYKQKAVEIRIDFDGSGAKAAGFEDEADAASGDAFAEATDDSSGDQHILHFSSK